jgi:hypothetical protein
MNRVIFAVVLFLASVTANAATFSFSSDPFASSTALTTPGRQIVGGEPFINFDVTADQFLFDVDVFAAYGFGPGISFVNDVIGNVPAGGANVIVLRTFDNDADATTPFGAGNAANLIADQVTASGAGFFIYFNSGLNLPRLVFSTNLSDNTADLAIMSRMLNFTGDPNGLSGFGAADFAVPVPGTLLLLGPAWALLLLRRSR